VINTKMKSKLARLERITIQHMVKWMREKPEVIAYLRYLYSDNALPDWVGKFKEKVDYAEILRRAGVEIPAMVDDASASASEEDDRVNEEGEEDVQEGTPAQGSTIVANDFSAQAGAVGHGPAQTGARGRTAQTRADTDAAETRKEAQEKTVIRRSSKIPDPIVDTTVKPLPVILRKPQHTKRGMGGRARLRRWM
jgi:hypothetical protein